MAAAASEEPQFVPTRTIPFPCGRDPWDEFSTYSEVIPVEVGGSHGAGTVESIVVIRNKDFGRSQRLGLFRADAITGATTWKTAEDIFNVIHQFGVHVEPSGMALVGAAETYGERGLKVFRTGSFVREGASWDEQAHLHVPLVAPAGVRAEDYSIIGVALAAHNRLPSPTIGHMPDVVLVDVTGRVARVPFATLLRTAAATDGATAAEPLALPASAVTITGIEPYSTASICPIGAASDHLFVVATKRFVHLVHLPPHAATAGAASAPSGGGAGAAAASAHGAGSTSDGRVLHSAPQDSAGSWSRPRITRLTATTALMMKPLGVITLAADSASITVWTASESPHIVVPVAADMVATASSPTLAMWQVADGALVPLGSLPLPEKRSQPVCVEAAYAASPGTLRVLITETEPGQSWMHYETDDSYSRFEWLEYRMPHVEAWHRRADAVVAMVAAREAE